MGRAPPTIGKIVANAHLTVPVLAETLIESSPDGLLLVAADGTIRVANGAAGALFGLTADELVGSSVEQLVPSEHRHEHVGHRSSYADEPRRRPMGTGLQLFAQHTDGTMFPVEISLSPVEIGGETFTIATIRDVSERREAVVRIELMNERERIAHDLHDTVIQRLFAAGMSLQVLASSQEDSELRERAESVIDELDESIRVLRSAIFALGQSARHGSFRAHLTALVTDGSRHLRGEPTISIDGDPDEVPLGVREHLAATLTEALSNVVRHADAGEVHVEIVVGVSDVCVSVTDDGVGIAEDPKRGRGLTNMMWRASELGGSCTVEPGDAGGTQLRWRVPK